MNLVCPTVCDEAPFESWGPWGLESAPSARPRFSTETKSMIPPIRSLEMLVNNDDLQAFKLLVLVLFQSWDL